MATENTNRAHQWQELLQKSDVLGGIHCPDFMESLAAHCHEVFLPAEYLLVKQGDPIPWLYILVSGRIRFHVNGVTLAELAQGACLGELSILDRQPSPVSISTLEPCHFLTLSEQDLLEALEAYPGVFLQMTQGLYNKLRRLSDLQEDVALGKGSAVKDCARGTNLL